MYMDRRIKQFFTVLLLIVFAAPLFSQGIDTKIELSERMQMQVSRAMASTDYLVTAGDIYTIGFLSPSGPISYTAVVDSSYKLRIANMAIIQVEGKTFIETKAMVEEIVSRNFPMSGVQFVLAFPAHFTVAVKGEVSSTTEPQTWSLSRLSSVLQPFLTAYSSLRDVTVVSNKGQRRSYDLFKAARFGDLNEDPYLRPGDTIIVNKLDQNISISGAVERPGTYQMLKGEGLKDLIEIYASGLTHKADPSRIELVRNKSDQHIAGEKIFLNAEHIEENIELKN